MTEDLHLLLESMAQDIRSLSSRLNNMEIESMAQDIRSLSSRLNNMDTERHQARHGRAMYEQEVIQRLTRVESGVNVTNGRVTKAEEEIAKIKGFIEEAKDAVLESATKAVVWSKVRGTLARPLLWFFTVAGSVTIGVVVTDWIHR